MVFKRRERNFSKDKRGQITLFIIIAIVIVASIFIFFLFRDSLRKEIIPASVQPVYTSFLNCIEDSSLLGISLLNSQGGYIDLPEFEPGSQFMPFSSQLNFLGNPIPYWDYVSGNNIQKEQIPSRRSMENQLGNFVGERISDCNYDSYYSQGFEISWTKPTSRVNIKENNVEIDLNTDLKIVYGDDVVIVRNHKISVNSKLGTLFDSAMKVYNKEKEELFLENYAIDILWNYAPVEGVEITCSPLIWSADKIFDDLQEAIEANTFALTTKASRNDYFFVDVPIKEEVRFLNSRNWPHSFEVTPADGGLLVSTPVGNQPGLGILGFCYVKYSYVYDMKYPVLVQIHSGNEIFQFPVAVVIRGNNPREPIFNGGIGEDESSEFCQYKNVEVNVNVKNKNGVPIKANISYECFSHSCFIGETSDTGTLTNFFPQCVNGYVRAQASGYRDERYILSTVSSSSVDILLDKLYSKTIQLNSDGKDYNGEAIIYFVSDSSTKTLVYPEQKEVELSEGQYEIQVYIFGSSQIKMDEIITEQCVEVPRAGLFGIIGLKEQRCFDIKVPEQTLSQILIGGGKQSYYVLESELVNSNVLEINSLSLPKAENIAQLQNNYALFDENGLEIVFK